MNKIVKISEESIYDERPFDKWHALYDMSQLAVGEEMDVTYKGKIVHLLPGQFVCRIEDLMSRWGWTRQMVRTFINNHSNNHCSVSHLSVITLLKQNVLPTNQPFNQPLDEKKRNFEKLYIDNNNINNYIYINNIYNNSLYIHNNSKDERGRISEDKKIGSNKDYLLSIPDRDLKEFTKTYKVNEEEVKIKAEELYYWLAATGNERQDYRMFLIGKLLEKFGKRDTGYVWGMKIIGERAKEI